MEEKSRARRPRKKTRTTRRRPRGRRRVRRPRKKTRTTGRRPRRRRRVEIPRLRRGGRKGKREVQKEEERRVGRPIRPRREGGRD